LRINGTDRKILAIFDPESVAWDMEFNVQNDMLYLSLKDANKIIVITSDSFEEDIADYGYVDGNDDSKNNFFEEQILSALNFEDTACNIGFKEVVKKSTNQDACVKSSSVQKLIERGWAQDQN
jgi:hypothetical protein